MVKTFFIIDECLSLIGDAKDSDSFAIFIILDKSHCSSIYIKQDVASTKTFFFDMCMRSTCPFQLEATRQSALASAINQDADNGSGCPIYFGMWSRSLIFPAWRLVATDGQTGTTGNDGREYLLRFGTTLTKIKGVEK